MNRFLVFLVFAYMALFGSFFTCLTFGQEPASSDLNAESIRQAQTAVLNRILREADSGDPAELLKLSQTLSTLQATEASQDALMVARAIEPQLEHLPEFVQTLQRNLLQAQIGDMLDEFRHHEEQLLPMMRGIIQVWGNSLDMGQEVQRQIKEADKQHDAKDTAKRQTEEEKTRLIATTYRWKYVGDRNSSQIYQVTRRDGEEVDAKADAILTEFFGDRWVDVAEQHLIEDKGLNPKGVLFEFDTWEWRRVNQKLENLRAVQLVRAASAAAK